MEGIFRWIKIARRLIIGNIRNSQIPEHIINGLAIVAKCYRNMMRETLLNEHMTIESAHFRNGKDADAAKGIRGCRQDFTLRNIGSKLTVRSALQTEERDVPLGNIAFERAAREVRRAAVFEQTVLNELIFHAAS